VREGTCEHGEVCNNESRITNHAVTGGEDGGLDMAAFV
jgi:hypothetical protein